jgi:streptogramin lyase
MQARHALLWAAIAMLGLLSPAAHAVAVRSYGITDGGPHAVAPSSDGSAVFVGARDCGYIGRFDLAGKTFASQLGQPTLPCTDDGNGDGRGPFSMVEGPDGKLYFTVYDADPVDGTGTVARVNPGGTGFQASTAGVHPLDITVGPDNKVWFTVNGPPGKVGRVDPATFNVDTFNVPGSVQGPRGIVSGGDGNLYVLGGEAGVIWRVTTAVTPVITQVASSLNGPSFGELGPDGKIWLTLLEGDGVTTFTPGSSAVGTPTSVPGQPWDVAFGNDGNAYVTRFGANSIAQIVPGTPGFTALTLPTTSGAPVFIESAPNGNLYAAGNGEDTLFEVSPDVRSATGAPAGALSPTPIVASASRLKIAPSAFLAAARGPSIRNSKRKRRTGAKVSYRLNVAATVRFTVQRRTTGRRVGKRCVRRTRRNRSRRRCTRYLRVRGSFTRAGTAGNNSFRFTGRLRGRKLRPRSYRLVATPSAGGVAGRAARTSFRIVRGGH